MKLEIQNCNNIDTGSITIEENLLNIKYAMNGTGKSTIARAIELHLKGAESIKELTPFKFLGSTDENQMPKISGLNGISSVAVLSLIHI